MMECRKYLRWIIAEKEKKRKKEKCGNIYIYDSLTIINPNDEC